MNTDEMKQLYMFGEKPKDAPRAKARPTVAIGPTDKTCGDCKHAVRFRPSKSWHKCELNQGRWTGGTGTDIRLRDIACGLFEQEDQD